MGLLLVSSCDASISMLRTLPSLSEVDSSWIGRMAAALLPRMELEREREVVLSITNSDDMVIGCSLLSLEA